VEGRPPQLTNRQAARILWPYPGDSLNMSHGWSTEEAGELSADRRAIIEAVESWLVDPRPRPRLHHESARVNPIAQAPAEVHLDGDLAGFLARNGLV
jgi:hypothetical protein